MTALLIVFPLAIVATLAAVGFSVGADTHAEDMDYKCCDAIGYKDYSLDSSSAVAESQTAQREFQVAA
jgi:hypothetical protein